MTVAEPAAQVLKGILVVLSEILVVLLPLLTYYCYSNIIALLLQLILQLLLLLLNITKKNNFINI